MNYKILKCIVWGISGMTDFYLQKRSLAMQMCLKNVMQLASNAALQKGTFLLFHKDHKHKVPCNLSHIEKRHFISGRNNIACMVQQPLWLILEEVIAKLVNIFLPLCASERMRKKLKEWKWLHVHNKFALTGKPVLPFKAWLSTPILKRWQNLVLKSSSISVRISKADSLATAKKNRVNS